MKRVEKRNLDRLLSSAILQHNLEREFQNRDSLAPSRPTEISDVAVGLSIVPKLYLYACDKTWVCVRALLVSPPSVRVQGNPPGAPSYTRASNRGSSSSTRLAHCRVPISAIQWLSHSVKAGSTAAGHKFVVRTTSNILFQERRGPPRPTARRPQFRPYVPVDRRLLRQ